ncbi:MAG: bifunctional transaldolase/phosoglucose isomerase [Deltaproteobacteria bacterium]|nr:bifunctional transaldolase/phosoglucose isomerase [Deltaproteobacteria bacterium]
MNRIRQIGELGQSIWYDDIQRRMIWTGDLHRRVQEDGLKGVTSNPAIFEAAIARSDDYHGALAAAARNGASALETYETIAVEDIQWACDVLHSVHVETQGRDGFVSLEVSPHHAHDTRATIEEGARLWTMVDRPNLMIKVPATPEGLPAIERLITEGVNVNVTLLFSVERYRAVFEAFMAGLEARATRSGDVRTVASVASFFVSRIDTMVDGLLTQRLAQLSSNSGRQQIERLMGQAGIASAKLAYEAYESMVLGARWKALAAQGAQAQRLLYGSTSTKNPAYRDVRYVEALIGPDTVNTVPAATYEAFKDHGEARPATLKIGLDEAKEALAALEKLGVSMNTVTDRLLQEGVAIFVDAFDRLIGSVEQRRRAVLGPRLVSMRTDGPDALRTLDAHLERLRKARFGRRLWAKDPTLFSGQPDDHDRIGQSMGWLTSVDSLLDQADPIVDLYDELDEEGIEHVVLIGIGGSSISADVLHKIFEDQPGSPRLHVLDSIVPAQILAVEAAIELDTTLFILASKNGTTPEVAALDDYFWNKVQSGDQFIAITDPGTPLEDSAVERGFRAVFSGDAETTESYAALSCFGMVPASAMGIDVVRFLTRTRLMVGSCEHAVPPAENAGIRLGTLLGDLALSGRDKITLVSTPSLAALGEWLEQLIAESTGKAGRGIIPIDGEPLSTPDLYGVDRVFVYFKLAGDGADKTAEIERKLSALSSVGHPVLNIVLDDVYDLGQEMFRWQVATVTAAHILGVNPFSRPNVEETNALTQKRLNHIEPDGTLAPAPGERLVFEDEALTVFANEEAWEQIKGVSVKSIADVFDKILENAPATEYVALMAYIAPDDEVTTHLSAVRDRLRTRFRSATTLGFGPKLLHSTGQLHKGGPATGVFIQITADDAEDIEIPSRGYTFGTLKRAQEQADFMALSQRQRPILRIHLSQDSTRSLTALKAALAVA